MNYVTEGDLWSLVASKLSYPMTRGWGALIKLHYSRILYPFEIYSDGKNVKFAHFIVSNIKLVYISILICRVLKKG